MLEKLVACYTSRDPAIAECGLAARQALTRARRFEAVLAEHRVAWQYLWRHFDVHLQPAGPAFTLNVPMLLRLNMLHLLQAVSPNSIGLDIGVPPRGWTGEAYQGHIFWDELFIFPFLNYRMPEITRSLLLYRYRRLGAARVAARRAGCQGAMFPWQSGSDGQEETQELNLNPRSQRWVPDHSYLQRHVGSAIAYNVWQYFQVTHDVEFLQCYGAELLLEIARFWSSLAQFNDARGRYEIHGVMGPDEFHEGYPDASTPGLNNNAYTNLMAVWVLCRALDVLALLPDLRRAELMTRLGLSADECTRWGEISRRMYVPFHGDGIISQFEGYDQLAELDWEAYRTRYGNIQRLDLILEAEQDSANRYKLSKQADVLMLFYLLSAEELGALFARLGYPFDAETMPRNVAYYDSRSSHGSTLSRVVQAWVLARVDRPRALTYFAEALQSDVTRYPAGHRGRGRASRRHGGHGRSGAARRDRARGDGGRAAARPALAGGAGASRYAHPLSGAYARSAPDADRPHGAGPRAQRGADPAGVQKRRVRVHRRQHAGVPARLSDEVSRTALAPRPHRHRGMGEWRCCGRSTEGHKGIGVFSRGEKTDVLARCTRGKYVYSSLASAKVERKIAGQIPQRQPCFPRVSGTIPTHIAKTVIVVPWTSLASTGHIEEHAAAGAFPRPACFLVPSAAHRCAHPRPPEQCGDSDHTDGA